MRIIRHTGIVVVVLLALSVFRGYQAEAALSLDWPDSISLSLIEDGLSLPVHITHAGDGSGRLFVVEQAGRVRIIQNGTLVSTPFLDIRGRVRAPGDPGAGGEEGLLSIAFPPGYETGRNYFYVYYTNLNSDNRVSRFYLTSDLNIADPDSEELILLIPHPGQTNHNGGQIFFGPDGYLYIGTGDGGGGDDPDDNAENPGVLLGKMLRIAVEPEMANPGNEPVMVFLPLMAGANSVLYTIPADNPFVGQPGYLPEIWALGLRNPWRFSFDRQTGDLYIGDVGQDRREEIDFQDAGNGGQNYGWDIMEGDLCNEPVLNCDMTGLTVPVQVYVNPTLGQSVTGGYVYRGTTFTSLQGIYFYADYVSGRIWGLQYDTMTSQWESRELRDTINAISSFGEDQAGELYLTDRASGEVYQIVTP